MSAIDYHLRPQTPSDYGFIQQLYAATRTAEMSACDWPEDIVADFLGHQCRIQYDYYREQFPDGEFWLIERQGNAVGRLYLFWDRKRLQLIDIALLPDHRGRGLGSRLLGELLARADDLGLAVALHVEPGNPALRLYRRLGFDVVAEEGFYLEMRRPAATAGVREA